MSSREVFIAFCYNTLYIYYNEFMMATNEKQAIFFLLTTHSYNSVPSRCYGLRLNIPKCSDVIFLRKHGLEKSVQGNKGQAE